MAGLRVRLDGESGMSARGGGEKGLADGGECGSLRL